MVELLNILLLLFLIVCALGVAYIRDLLSAVVLFSAFGLIMAIIWQQLSAPDVAMVEAALGTGVAALLMIAAISKTKRVE
ncbi:MAG: hydrogenase subunit MbhD domain-containing protein [Bacillota bacterium]|jgi:energy-converting hydrogenase B subunit D|nr:hydrogenase subunit MbhD domain-containing protein [Bacillota bacterium]